MHPNSYTVEINLTNYICRHTHTHTHAQFRKLLKTEVLHDPISANQITNSTNMWLTALSQFHNLQVFWAICHVNVKFKFKTLQAIGNKSVQKNITNNTLIAISISYFQTITVSVYFIWKIYLYFSTGNGQPNKPACEYKLLVLSIILWI